MRELSSLEPKHALAVGGLDPITGAGLYADIKTFGMMKILPLALATCLVIENSNGVKGVVPFPQELVRLQLKAILEDCTPHVAKISLVYTSSIVELLAEELPRGMPIVLDPILKSWDGHDLITTEGLNSLIDLLLPRSTVVTLNTLEASSLSKVEVHDLESAKEAARRIADLGAKSIVIKGGHLTSQKVFDVLYCQGDFLVIEKERHLEDPYHGLGCVFASSLAALIAHGLGLTDAFTKASLLMDYVIRGSYKLKGKARIANPLELYYKSLDFVEVIEEMYEALKVIESMRGLNELAPEVGVNIVMCLRNPTSLDEVCGVEGRLRPVRGFLRAQGAIKFGASKHLGAMLLEVNRKWPSIRACMNIKYSEAILKAIRELNFKVASFDRSKEPLEVKMREGLSMKWGAREAIKELTEEPDVIYDLGDLGKEPMVRVFGRNALDVIRKVRLIASKLRDVSPLKEPPRD
ncbi:MAG: bifunctional hydroxymethylpyrimidine kinase/phosphomethylpyrimidine kinase [Candidatus Nezhaarchaeales archaeon]